MGLVTYPPNYVNYNSLQSKNLVVVVEIEGIDLLSNIPAQSRWRYGDAGLVYGLPGVVYGGLRPVDGQRSLLSLDAGLTISQQIEPEQGRSSISTLTLPFIDKNSYMTQVCTPGLIVDDILGKKVKIHLGYQQNSYPEDYFIIFRGIVTSIEAGAGLFRLQFSDSQIKTKQDFFFTATSLLSSAIDDTVTTIPVNSNSDFHKKITGPDGTYFTGVKCFVLIDDEYIQYQQTGSESTGFGVNQFVGVLRGQRGTTAAPHDINSDVTASIEIQDHGIDMALRHMLSGWQGPYKSNIPIFSMFTTPDPLLGDIDGSIILPFGVDAVEDHGFAEGDFITVTGDSHGGNNGVVHVKGFLDLFGEPNRIVLTDGTFVSSIPSAALLSVRSQFDVYPDSCGAMLAGEDVDVAGHIQLKNEFLSQVENTFRMFITDTDSCKTYLESQVYLPMGAYSLTRFGRLSVGYTKPPIADERLQVVDLTTVLNAPQIKVTRSVNNRKFFNEIDYSLDADDQGNFTRVVRNFDSDSVSIIGITSILPIESKGSRTDLGFDAILDRRVRFFLGRYKNGAIMLNPQVNWETGSLIEAGDVVAVKDNGQLQICNFTTGQRNLGTQLFEVINRSMDIKSGNVSLQLLGGITNSANDRFATISPSSLVDTGSTTTTVRIKDSFGVIFFHNERRKWEDYVGLKIKIHSYDYTFDETVTLTSLSSTDKYAFTVDPPLSVAPPPDYIVDLADYSTSSDPSDQALVKTIHCFIDPTVLVTSGVSNTKFNVGAGDVAKFFVGTPISIHNTSYSIVSNERLVKSIVGTTIEADGDLGFTAAAGQQVELIGFSNDSGAPYRLV